MCALTRITGPFVIFLVTALLNCSCGGGGGNNGGRGKLNGSILSLSTKNLAFAFISGNASDPTPSHVFIANTGTSTLSFSATSDSPWLSVSPASGAAPASLQISVAPGNMTANTYNGEITITSAEAQGSPAKVTVHLTVATAPLASNNPSWAQWGANPQHAGTVDVAAQNVAHQLADVLYDPFVPQEQIESEGELLTHYQATITDGNDMYTLAKTGKYTLCPIPGDWENGAPCGPNAWQTMIWNEARFTWINGALAQVWNFESDWKPEPNSTNITLGSDGLQGVEPVFHPVDANDFIYVPGAAGTIWKVDKNTGTSAAHIAPPLSGMATNEATAYVAGPLTADANGNIYYNVIALRTQGDPWTAEDVFGAWLVKVTPADAATAVTFASLTPTAPAGNAVSCPGRFTDLTTLPWPPADVVGTNQQPPTTVCGSQRPGINIAPAVAADGTIYTVSRAHFNAAQAYLIAVKPDLTLKWQATMRNVLSDGCGALVPISAPANMDANSCRNGATPGVDPRTNAKGSGSVPDEASSSPTVLPDGSIVFGALDNYNYSRGHLFKFDAQGNFQAAYDFGWDSTPAVYAHDGTYSIVIKDNHYGSPAYCHMEKPTCVPTPQVFYITQLDPNMQVEWKFQSTNTMTCTRDSNGVLNCVSDQPDGFEWCINMPAIDVNGNVYVNSEDGNIYVLPQGHSGIFTQPTGNLFLNLAIGAAYTPLFIGTDGKLYTQNDGHLLVVGN